MTSSADSTWRRSAPIACSIALGVAGHRGQREPTRRSRSRRSCPALRRKTSASNSRMAFSPSRARKGPRLRTRTALQRALLWPVRAAHPSRRNRGRQSQCLVQERCVDSDLPKKRDTGAIEGETDCRQRQVTESGEKAGPAFPPGGASAGVFCIAKSRCSARHVLVPNWLVHAKPIGWSS